MPSDEFEEFVAATSGRLLGTAVLLCGDHHLAQDLVQTTYTKVFTSWRRVRGADNPVAYARAILLKTYLSHQRRRSSSESPVEVVPDAAGVGPDTTVRMDLLTALGELSQQDRAVLVLRYWEDLSVGETSRALGITDVACRSRTSRALARLRAHVPDLEDLR